MARPAPTRSSASWPSRWSPPYPLRSGAGSRAMDRPHEVELKYAIADPDAVRALLDGIVLPGLVAGAWRVRIDRDTYIDTAAGDLARAGYGVRVRRRGGRHTLALKSVASDADGHEHEEYNTASPLRREEL